MKKVIKWLTVKEEIECSRITLIVMCAMNLIGGYCVLFH